ncbi:MAG: response regulator [Armatimonadetes bacterium]|nr:response regulator [Armatimonadota bacterium]
MQTANLLSIQTINRRETKLVAEQKRVLVIDDEESVRDAYINALEDMPCVVETASSGEEGLQKARTGSVALIFLDLKMPGMSGADVLRQIRAFDAKVAIYVVTAFQGEFLEALEAIERDGLTFKLLQKPIGQQAIRKVTATTLGGDMSE